MTAVLDGFSTIGVVVAVGFLLAHLGLVDERGQRALSTIAFNVASPALLLTIMQDTSPGALLSANLWTAALSAYGAMTIYAVIAHRWRRELPPGTTVIGALCVGYVNAGNLGLPIAFYVLGDVARAAPTMLMQLLLIAPPAMALLHSATSEGGNRLRTAFLGAVTNPIVLGSVIGLLLSVCSITLPGAIAGPLDLLGGMAVPSMLIAFGIALRLGPRPAGNGSAPHVWTLVAIKTLVNPSLALAIGLLFGLGGIDLFTVVIMAALPTAQNVFIYAHRYGRGEHLARDAILISTFASVPLIVIVSFAFHLLAIV